jgi:hypothetical protein
MTKGTTIHARLKTLIEVPTTRHLWTPQDTTTFIPPVMSKIYGDGRALFRLTTINDRPAYWVIRGDSGWQCGDVHAPDNAPDFVDFLDDILTCLEDEFGRALCGYNGSSLYTPPSERDCTCEECSDPDNVAQWPNVDSSEGCLWDRIDWPAEFGTIDHPWTWQSNLLALEEELAFTPGHPRITNFWLRAEIERAARMPT